VASKDKGIVEDFRKHVAWDPQTWRFGEKGQTKFGAERRNSWHVRKSGISKSVSLLK
jgi:hypothetical protein